MRRSLLASCLLPVWLLVFASLAVASPVDNFFSSDKIYLVQINNWDPELARPEQLSKILDEVRFKGSQLDLYQIDPLSPLACDIKNKKHLHRSNKFEIEMTGQTSKWAPKSSYKFKLKDSDFLSMKALNLKGMWYDPSQMREALAWSLFRDAGVLGFGQTYVRLCIEAEGKNNFFGLYSMVEHPDITWAKREFGRNAEGNYYSANYKAEDIGAANLAPVPALYYHPYMRDRTYQLKNFSGYEENDNYGDLGELIRVINGPDVQSKEYRKRLEKVFDVRGFLKWAAVSHLLGAWDNYWCSPQNFALYNEGTMEEPYFHWLPWDYDAVLGSRDLKWANTDLFDWESSTEGCGAMYNRIRERTADIPLIRNVLSNPVYRKQYADFMKEVLRKHFSEEKFESEIRRIWNLIGTSVLLEEKDGNQTGRYYRNEVITRHISDQNYIVDGLEPYYHILRFARESRQNALKQLRN